jgi:sugar lactone lactonase YvrE
MICMGAEDYVYVTEVLGARVQRISPSDRWAGQVSRWGVELGQLYRPKGIAADDDGRLYVSDSTLGVVQVFSSRGITEGALTDEVGNALRFQHPMGMCLDSTGRLYVVELGADRVAIVQRQDSRKSVAEPPSFRSQEREAR